MKVLQEMRRRMRANLQELDAESNPRLPAAFLFSPWVTGMCIVGVAIVLFGWLLQGLRLSEGDLIRRIAWWLLAGGIGCVVGGAVWLMIPVVWQRLFGLIIIGISVGAMGGIFIGGISRAFIGALANGFDGFLHVSGIGMLIGAGVGGIGGGITDIMLSLRRNE
jgi:hypothetical protein